MHRENTGDNRSAQRILRCCVAYQRGQGIGSSIKGLFRTIWATVKQAGITAGKEVIQAGSEATRDYLREGVDFKTEIKRRSKQALGRTVSSLGKHLQEGKAVGPIAGRKGIKEVNRKPKHRRYIFNG